MNKINKTKHRDWCPFLKGFRCNAKKGYIPYGQHLKKFCLGSWKKYELCNFYINKIKSRIALRSAARIIDYAGGRFDILDKKKIKRALRT